MVAGGVSKHTTDYISSAPIGSAQSLMRPPFHSHARAPHPYMLLIFFTLLCLSVCVFLPSPAKPANSPRNAVLVGIGLLATYTSIFFYSEANQVRREKRRTRRGHEYVGLMMIGTKAPIGRGLFGPLLVLDSSHLFFSYPPFLPLLFHRPFGIAPRTV